MLLRRESFRQLCQAREMLVEIEDEMPSIAEIARAVGISHYHFIRRFESVFGLTPHQFRTRARVDRAKLLLATGHRTVTEVCMEVGFSSLGSFSDLFARHVGVAPSAYQRQARVMIRVPGGLPRELFPGCLSLMGCLPLGAFRNFREASSPATR